jgi:hypothetical protein
MTTTHKRVHHPLLSQGRDARPLPINGVAGAPADRYILLDYPSAAHAPAHTAPAELACPYCGRHHADAWPLRVAVLLAVAVLGIVVGAWW